MQQASTATQPRDKLLTAPFVLACAASFFNAFSFQLLLPVIPLYLLHIGGHEWQLGFIMGVTALTALLARPFVGYFADRVGRKPLLLAGPATYAVNAGLYALAQSVPPLMAARAVQGVGLSAVSTGSSTYVADLAPPTRRGEAMGLYGSSFNVASAMAPFTGAWLADAYGFGTVFLVSGATAVVSLLLALRLPEVMTRAAAAASRTRGIGGSLFSKDALLPSTLGIFFTATFGAIVTLLPVLSEREGIGNPGFFFLPYSITIILTRVVSGKASDRFGRVAVLVPGMLALSGGMVLIAATTSIWMFLAAAIVYGVGFGTVHPTLMAMVADRARPGQQGVAMSTFTGAFDLGIGGGSVLWGAIVVVSDERGAFLAAALMPLLGLALLGARSRQFSADSPRHPSEAADVGTRS